MKTAVVTMSHPVGRQDFNLNDLQGRVHATWTKRDSVEKYGATGAGSGTSAFVDYMGDTPRDHEDVAELVARRFNVHLDHARQIVREAHRRGIAIEQAISEMWPKSKPHYQQSD